MPNLEVEVMLENHSHLFVVEVDSVLEAQQLKGKSIKCGKCNFHGKITHVGTPGRKSHDTHPTSDKQKSILEED